MVHAPYFVALQSLALCTLKVLAVLVPPFFFSCHRFCCCFKDLIGEKELALHKVAQKKQALAATERQLSRRIRALLPSQESDTAEAVANDTDIKEAVRFTAVQHTRRSSRAQSHSHTLAHCALPFPLLLICWAFGFLPLPLNPAEKHLTRCWQPFCTV